MTSIDDLRKAIAEDDGSLPERWNPDDVPGTTLVGTLLRFELIVTKMGEGTIAVVEDADDGHEWGVALFRTVLKNLFERHKPNPGDTVGVKYIGWMEPPNKNSNGYHNYSLRVLRNSAAPAPLQPVGATSKPADDADDDDSLPF